MPKVEVTQDELEYATGLLNQLDSVQARLDSVAGVIFQKLNNGCALESGPLGAELRTQRTATATTTSLLVNGREV
jgi:hypothetical protein